MSTIGTMLDIDPAVLAIEVRSPLDGSLLFPYKATGEARVEQLVRNGRAALEQWRALPVPQRAERLHHLATLLESSRDLLAADDRPARGISEAQALDETTEMVRTFRFYAGLAAPQVQPASVYIEGHTSYVGRRPLGLLAAILPWNYPLLMLGWRVAPMLAAGNAVIVKPAEQTPMAAQRLKELADRALGQDVVQIAQGDGSTGALLVRSEGIDGIAFTGSRSAGIDVQRGAAPKPVWLELGGNCPALFFDDAPEGSEDRLVAAAFHNAGQSCAAPSRVIVQGHRALDRVLAAVRRSSVTEPLISVEAAARVEGLVRALGTRKINQTFGHPVPQHGAWVQPRAVVIRCGSDVPLRTQETFGPVITVEVADDPAREMQRMLDLALDPACGNDLAASVWTSSMAVQQHCSLVLGQHVGEVWTNCALVQSPGLPHSGQHGLDLSPEALLQYSRPTAFTAQRAI